MVKQNFVTIVASLTALILATGSDANARVYDYTFTSVSDSMSGQFTDEVTNITGTLSGGVDDTITGFVANPSFPNPVYTPDWAFIYSDVFYSGQDPNLDVYGVVFTTARNPGGYWNLWAAGPGNYSLYESSPGGGYPIAIDGGYLDPVAVPETSTWAMMILGFAGLGFAGYRPHRSRLSRSRRGAGSRTLSADTMKNA